MDEKKRIIIAEDRTIVREGLRLLVSSNPHYSVIGEAEDGHQAVKIAVELQPDLMLMDLTMPRMNGMEAIREIKKQCPHIRVLVLTVHDSDEFVTAALHAGADGYVLKEANQTELMLAITNVLHGKRFISPGISEKVIDGYLNDRLQVKAPALIDTLTHREREILKLVAEGYKNKEIADMLCISIKTVEKHRENIMKKLDLHNVSSLTAFAIEKGLLEKKDAHL